jgi:hypothetical protein
MRVDWKIKGSSVPRWVYGFWAVALLLMGCYYQWKGMPQMWAILGVQAGFLVLFFRFVLPLRSQSGFVKFDGDRLDFSGNTGGPWHLADVDSVTIQDCLIQIRLYRPGRMGNEFTARAELVPAENWVKLTALCRKIEAGMNPAALPLSNNLEEVA